MSDSAIRLGWVVGVLVFAVSCTLTTVKISNDWAHKVAWHQHHLEPTWTRRQGTIVAEAKPDHTGGGPPTIRSTIRFRDWYGKTQTTRPRLRYFAEARLGEPIEVDVAASGQLWIPSSPDYAWCDPRDCGGPHGQYLATWPGPYVAHHSFGTGGGGIFAWIVLELAVAYALGYGVTLLADGRSFRGRLGSR